MDLHELDVRINAAGLLPTQINDAVVALINGGKVSVLDLGPLLTPLGKLSGALADIQALSNAEKAKGQRPDAQIPPGYRVVDVGDVGDDQGHGAQRAANLSPPNWAYVQQHNLMPKWAQIFADPLPVVNAAIGVVTGNITQFGDGDPIIRGEGGAILGDLSAWG